MRSMPWQTPSALAAWGRGGVALLLASVLALSACQVDSADPLAVTDSAVGVSPGPGTEPTAIAAPEPTPQPTPPQPTPPQPTPPQPTPPQPTPSAPPQPTPSPTATPTPTAVPISVAFEMSTLETVECPAQAASAQITCSLATVPLDATQPVEGEVVKLMVAFVDNGDPHGVGPVVFLQGGPGVASVDRARSFVGGSHDLYFVDHRGVGLSEPRLSCLEADALWQALLTDDEAIRIDDQADVVAAYRACGDRLVADGIAFEHFNTEAAATDVELLRQLLGFDEWSVWGISYGTRIGLTVMRDHPAGVRSAVLDSVVPFEVDFFATIPENGWRAIRALDQACDNSTCAGDHGDFVENLSALVKQLNQEPAVVPVTRSGTGQEFLFRVDGPQMLDIVFTQLHSTARLGSLPRQVSRADFGGIEEMVAGYVAGRDPDTFDFSQGTYYTTWCREEFPFYDSTTDDELLIELEPLFDDSTEEAYSSDGIDELCAIFDVPASTPQDNEPIVSDIPTLVFAGAFDPITPPAWSKQVADALTNAAYVEMADHGHGMATACPSALRLAFLIDPLAPLDTSCVDAIEGPDFE